MSQRDKARSTLARHGYTEALSHINTRSGRATSDRAHTGARTAHDDAQMDGQGIRRGVTLHKGVGPLTVGADPGLSMKAEAALPVSSVAPPPAGDTSPDVPFRRGGRVR